MRKKTKQILSLLISVVMIFSMFAGINFSVSAEDDILDYLSWEINNGEVTITDCDESISGDVVIPDTIAGYPVTVIGDGAFCDCYNIKSVIIGNNISTIGYGAFSGCSSLTYVVISDSVTTIDDWAFAYCSSLVRVTIGSGVETIEDGVFRYCWNLEKISIDPANKNYSSDEYGALFDKNKTTLIYYPPNSTATEYEIPEGVVSIADWAFELSKNLKKIVIPESTKDLGEGTFKACFSLESINIPEGVEILKEDLFLFCINLKSIHIPASVKFDYAQSFSFCFSLESVSLAEGSVIQPMFIHTFLDNPFMKEVYIYSPDIDLEVLEYVGYTCIENADELNKLVQQVKEDGMLFYTSDIDLKIIEMYNDGYDQLVKIEGFTIHGYEGSTAEAYAKEHGFNFIPLGDEEPEVPEIPDVPDVPETPENPEDNESENDFFSSLKAFFEKIAEFFAKIFETLKNLFA